MRNIIKILLYLILLGMQTCYADTSATQTFIINAETAVSVTVSGNLSSGINSATGNLTNTLNMNFNINSNANLSNIQVKAFVTDSSGNLDNAFYCTSTSSASTIPMYLVLANTNEAPAQSAISNCEGSTSTAENNVNAIAYSGNISIDNSGALNYNSSGGYFNATINSGTSNINLILNPTIKSGTFSTENIEDENGTYKAEIYLDNIP